MQCKGCLCVVAVFQIRIEYTLVDCRQFWKLQRRRELLNRPDQAVSDVLPVWRMRKIFRKSPPSTKDTREVTSWQHHVIVHENACKNAHQE